VRRPACTRRRAAVQPDAGRLRGSVTKPRRPDWPPELAGGGLSWLIGTAIILISFLDPRDDAFPEGRGVVLLAGLVFLVAGVAVLVPALARRRDTALLQSAIGATLLWLFAAIPLLIVLGGSRGLPLLASIAVPGSHRGRARGAGGAGRVRSAPASAPERGTRVAASGGAPGGDAGGAAGGGAALSRPGRAGAPHAVGCL
jgi:hypothetical protein